MRCGRIDVARANLDHPGNPDHTYVRFNSIYIGLSLSRNYILLLIHIENGESLKTGGSHVFGDLSLSQRGRSQLCELS